MALAKSIIIAHGGQIWVHSDGPNKGFLVGFSIPLSEEDGGRPQGDQELMRGSLGNLKPPLPAVTKCKSESLVISVPQTGSKGENGAQKEKSMTAAIKDDEIRATALTYGIIEPIKETSSSGKEVVAKVPEVIRIGPKDVYQNPSDLLPTKVHVLVVEDSQICRTMLKKLLSTLSCTVQEAEVCLLHFRVC